MVKRLYIHEGLPPPSHLDLNETGNPTGSLPAGLTLCNQCCDYDPELMY